MMMLQQFSLDQIQLAVGVMSQQQRRMSKPAAPSAAEQVAKIAAEAPDELKAKAMRLFQHADRDHSGTIDEHELHELLKELMGPISLPESNVIYHEMDANSSGSITFDEFLAGLVKYKWDTSKIKDTPQRDETAGYEWEMDYKEIEIDKKLGKGCFGIVYKAKWRGIEVAVKKLKTLGPKELEEFRAEIAILGKLRHPNVVLFMGASTTDAKNMCIVTEYMEGGSLDDAINKHGKKFTVREIINIGKQMSFGLNYLHLSNIIHRDVKLANMLVDKFWNVKLCDFGLSTAKTAGEDLTENVGSPLWKAPEILEGKPYNESCDVYSWAICIWELFSSQQPYIDEFGVSDLEELKDIVVTKHKRPTIPSICPAELALLMKSSWDGEPRKRPNFGQIIAHLERISNFLETPVF